MTLFLDGMYEWKMNEIFISIRDGNECCSMFIYLDQSHRKMQHNSSIECSICDRSEMASDGYSFFLSFECIQYQNMHFNFVHSESNRRLECDQRTNKSAQKKMNKHKWTQREYEYVVKNVAKIHNFCVYFSVFLFRICLLFFVTYL